MRFAILALTILAFAGVAHARCYYDKCADWLEDCIQGYGIGEPIECKKLNTTNGAIEYVITSVCSMEDLSSVAFSTASDASELTSMSSTRFCSPGFTYT